MSTMLDHYAQALQERVKQDTLRSLRTSRPLPNGLIELSERKLVNFASNDYLGLSQHPALIERSVEYAKAYGAGSGSSRLVSGNLQVFERIERKLAMLKGAEAALILPSGYQANSSILPTILDRKSRVAADRFIHRSMVEGLLLSRARWFRFAHNDFNDLKNRQNSQDESADSRAPQWILTESVFSADGDQVDLTSLLSFCEGENYSLFIDEAHATGVFGENGMGLSAGKKIPGICLGTFGKGLGSFGAYVCCSNLMREYLINFCPGLIYSTALPPPTLGAIDAALDLVPEMEKERQRLQDSAETLRIKIRSLGFDCGTSSTQIIPIILGSAKSTLSLASHLEEAGFFVPAIRPPTVPDGSSRLRLSLSAIHTDEQINDLVKSLRNWHEKAS